MGENEEIASQELTAEERKLLGKLRSQAKPARETGAWNDIPPALEDYPEDAIDNGDQAQVGQTYISYTAKSCKVHFDSVARQRIMPLPWYAEGDDQKVSYEDSKEATKTVHGVEVWSVLQPLPIKNIPSPECNIRKQLSKDSSSPTIEQRERHDRDVRAWRQKPMKDRVNPTVTSLPMLPNGTYWSDRWLPKIKENNGKWRPALADECAQWYTISEDKRRVDHLEGVIPDE